MVETRFLKDLRHTVNNTICLVLESLHTVVQIEIVFLQVTLKTEVRLQHCCRGPAEVKSLRVQILNIGHARSNTVNSNKITGFQLHRPKILGVTANQRARAHAMFKLICIQNGLLSLLLGRDLGDVKSCTNFGVLRV